MQVHIQAGNLTLDGSLIVPDNAIGVVLFAHGSGSSRFSERNRFVAETLNRAGLATLLFDLLSNDEHAMDMYTQMYRFDIPLLASRLIAAVDWAHEESATGDLPIGLFGASTGAAAALIAAAERPSLVRAVVSRGGRPDLAGEALPKVHAPTLLIVGSLDQDVLKLNRNAAAELKCENRIAVVPGASHLFEEPGKLAEAAKLAADWFERRLTETNGVRQGSGLRTEVLPPIF